MLARTKYKIAKVTITDAEDLRTHGVVEITSCDGNKHVEGPPPIKFREDRLTMDIVDEEVLRQLKSGQSFYLDLTPLETDGETS